MKKLVLGLVVFLLVVFFYVAISFFRSAKKESSSGGSELKLNIVDRVTQFFSSDKTKEPDFRPNIINQNPSVNVSVNSEEKLKKIVTGQFPATAKLTIIVSGSPFVIGVNDYWAKGDGTKIFFGGSSITTEQNNKIVNIAISIEAVRNANWTELAVATYLEHKLYFAIINTNQRERESAEVLADNYHGEIIKQFPAPLFKVNYVN